MENFIYSINVTFPIFLVMVIGYFLKQIGMLNDNFVTVANRFNFKVTLPFMLFRDIAGVDIRAVFDLKYVLFCALVSTACFWLIWGGVKLFLKDQTMRGAFVQASFRSSAAVMGLAFIQNIYGTSAMGPLMIVSAVPLYNIFSVIVLTFEGENASGVDGKQKIKEACIGIAKNPIILGILAGLIVGLLGIEFPTIINKTVNSVAQMATPLALITIGAGFEGRKALAKIKPTIAASPATSMPASAVSCCPGGPASPTGTSGCAASRRSRPTCTSSASARSPRRRCSTAMPTRRSITTSTSTSGRTAAS